MDHERFPYRQERLGLPMGLIPLIVVVQHIKGKVRPVMDYRELHEHVDAFTADANVCTAKLRECCQLEVNVALLDLQRAYLQVRVHESLWEYQTVLIKGRDITSRGWATG